MIEYSFDITERKQIEATIIESETKFRRVAELAKDAIITADRAGKIAFCNNQKTNPDPHNISSPSFSPCLNILLIS